MVIYSKVQARKTKKVQLMPSSRVCPVSPSCNDLHHFHLYNSSTYFSFFVLLQKLLSSPHTFFLQCDIIPLERDTSTADADADNEASMVRNSRKIQESILTKIPVKPSAQVKKDSCKVLKSVLHSCQTCLKNLNGFLLSVTNFHKFLLLVSSKSTLNSLPT